MPVCSFARAVLVTVAAVLCAGAAPPLYLSRSTYFGGDGADVITSTAIDKSGNIYIAGFTFSSNLPDTPGAFQLRHAGRPGALFSIFSVAPLPDAFVAKLGLDGALIYATYLGGADFDEALAIAADADGNAIVAGQTSSANFPVTASALNPSAPSAPGRHGFVSKLNASGSALIFSTYFGNSAFDQIRGIALDASGDIYLTGGSGGPFAARLKRDGSALVWSHTFGSGSSDTGTGIALDALGNSYVAGSTSSRQFPATPGAFQATFTGRMDAFVAKLDPSGNPAYATLLGGSQSTSAAGHIVVDAAGNVALSGSTDSLDFPVTPSALQPAHGGATDAFVSKLNSKGTALVFSTFLRGPGADTGSGIVADAQGNLWLAGSTIPTQPSATVAAPFSGSPCLSNGTSPFGANSFALACGDFYVAALDASGATLLYRSDFGGSHRDGAADLAINANGSLVVAGSTRSNDFPVTLPALQERRFRATCSTVSSPLSSQFDPCEDGFIALFTAQPPASPPFAVYNQATLVRTPLAPGEIVSLFGAGIGLATPTDSENTRVLFDGTPARLLFLDSGRIDAVVPADIASKEDVAVAVEKNGALVASIREVVGEASPAIPVQTCCVAGPAAALNQDGALNGPAAPAARGSIVSLYVLGLGAPPGAEGEVATSALPLKMAPQVVVGNQVAHVVYAGTSPGLLNVVAQINFVVPALSGDELPIYVLASGFTSQTGPVLAVK